jgi:hypothetical protein
VIAGLREERPDDFAVSLRLTWDGLSADAEGYRNEIEAYARAGVDHLVVAPSQSDPDSWQRSVVALADIFGLSTPGR